MEKMSFDKMLKDVEYIEEKKKSKNKKRCRDFREEDDRNVKIKWLGNEVFD